MNLQVCIAVGKIFLDPSILPLAILKSMVYCSRKSRQPSSFSIKLAGGLLDKLFIQDASLQTLVLLFNGVQ
jgi:hypothetical protein